MSKILTIVSLFVAASLNVSAQELAHRLESYRDIGKTRPAEQAPHKEQIKQPTTTTQGGLGLHLDSFRSLAPSVGGGAPAAAAAASSAGSGPIVTIRTSASPTLERIAPQNYSAEKALSLSISKQIMAKNSGEVYWDAVPSDQHTYGVVPVWVELDAAGNVISAELMRGPSDDRRADVFPKSLSVVKNSAPYKLATEGKPGKFTITFIYRKGDKKFKMSAVDEG